MTEMVTSNRERIGQMFDLMAPQLDEFLSRVINPQLGAGRTWIDIATQIEDKNGQEVHHGDVAIQLKVICRDYTHRFKPKWRPLSSELSQTHQAYAAELLQVHDRLAQDRGFADDDAYRALDTAERLAAGINATAAADAIARIRMDLRRVTAEKDDKKAIGAAVDNPEAAGLRPWREVLPPHDDVATGNFHASEFAADLYKVATGGELDADYADPVEFFNRTYLTEGLRDLIGRAVRRLSGDDNAPPVINLQTNFGGGKTHSMLSLWHLAAGLPLGGFSQDTQELLTECGYRGERVNRVAIVGNHLSPSGATKPDGTKVNTIWGELAWQLGGAEAYELVAAADQHRTHPGDALHELLDRYSPAVILIDEWVAYARSLVGRDDLAGGTFDDQFTFAQSLTETAKGTSGILLAISIPASERGAGSAPVAGVAEEVGGTNGLEALERLQNVVRRVADQWRPASSDEAYHIVKQRLFKQVDATALAAISATARAFVEMYAKYSDDFPRETRNSAYENRIKQTYPIHPELFDTLYEEWSSLERFQRTRGVLQLMSMVIHALWEGTDAAPLIMPSSIPLAAKGVNAQLAQYLQDSWKAIIDADVDGQNSEPARIDAEKPLYGQRGLTKRLARAVFFGAAPTIAPGSIHKGVSAKRVFLGTAVPGDVPGNFHSALTRLGDRATYFYSGSGKYWYDLQPNITRTAKDQAERLHQEDVWAEIVERLGAQSRARGDFAGLHICPETDAEIRDTDEARLVILHPKVAHRRGAESAAKRFARTATEQRGNANRTHRNMLVYLAADDIRLEELGAAIREYLGWKHVLDNEVDLDLTQNQRRQASQRSDKASQTADTRLLQTFVWALIPTQPDPAAPFAIRECKVEGQSEALAERVSRRLGNDGDLATQQAAAAIRLAIDRVPRVWEDGRVGLGALWALYSQYPYMPRLRDRSVLDAGIVDTSSSWRADGLALAEGYDASSSRFVGLWTPDDGRPPAMSEELLVVRPDVAAEQIDAGKADPPADPVPAPVNVTPHSKKDPEPPRPELRTRFRGVKTLGAEQVASGFKNIAEEVVAYLSSASDTLVVRVEIEATAASGFDEASVRAVSENAGTLGFEESAFGGV